MSRFIWGKIKEYFKVNSDGAFGSSIIDMINLLATQCESNKEKAQSGELGKTPQ